MSERLATKINAALAPLALPYVAVYEPAEDETVDSEIAIKRDGKPVPFSLQLDAEGSCLNRYYGEALGGAKGEHTAVQMLGMFGRGEDGKAIKCLLGALVAYHKATAPTVAQAAPTALKIELKGITHSERQSQETFCFHAALFLDGVKVGEVSNEGRGGAHRYQPYGCQTPIDAYAKTLPPKMYGDTELQPDGDQIISDIMAEWLTECDLRKLLASRIVCARPDGTIGQTARMRKEALAAELADAEGLARHFPGVKILNLMPFDEALTLYKVIPAAA